MNEDSCILYTRSITDDGYGRINHVRGVYRVHIYVLERKLGRKLLPGMFALHTCDVRNCVSEDHLYEGSHADNMRDMYARDRDSKSRFWNDSRYSRVLTADRVRVIRRLHGLGIPSPRIAQVFGVRNQVIHDVVLERTWKHV
jgi:hypothetical protein